jgi:hypothetical protein
MLCAWWAIKNCIVYKKGRDGNLISAPTTDLQGRYDVISIKWDSYSV